MSVRNTRHCWGLVINTGHETKVMKNSEKAKYKPSRLEIATNITVGVIFCIQICLALTFAIIGYFFQHSMIVPCDHKKPCNDHRIYLTDGDEKTIDDPNIGKLMGTWILLTAGLIPISIMITLEMCKFFQAMYM